MGASVTRSDFAWVYTDEPHLTRRKEMLKKYPEIKKLMGCDTNIARIVLAMVLVQVLAAYLLQNETWTTVVIVAYCFGGVVNHCMTLAIHEIGHNLAFGHTRLMWNRWIGFIGNTCVGVPMSISFKRYHQDHHRFQGEDGLDPDLPTEWEAILFHNTFTKGLWMFCQPLFYAFRPFVMRPKAPGQLEVINAVIQITFDLFIWYAFGPKAMGYLLLGSFLTMGLHPLAGHFISEHYMYVEGHETYSYYGPYNYLAFNVGYHMEHHDFPNVPGSRLPLISKIAPEYYNSLPQHPSFARVVWDFIFNPSYGPFARVKRPCSMDPRNKSPWDL